MSENKNSINGNSQQANYFDENEISEIKKTSLVFPMFFCFNIPQKVSKVLSIDSISGMSTNNGIPTEIRMSSISKNQQGQQVQKNYIYKLVEEK